MEEKGINHPSYYGGDNPYECIKVLQEWLTVEEFEGALKFNVFKYLHRYREKHGIKDLKKAQWYLNYLVEFLEGRDRDNASI